MPHGDRTLNGSNCNRIEVHENPNLGETKCLLTESQNCSAESLGTAGPHENTKQSHGTLGTCENRRESLGTAGSHQNHKESQGTVGSHEDCKESRDSSRKSCEKHPVFLDLSRLQPSAKPTMRAGTTCTTTTIAKPSAGSSVTSNSTKSGAKKATRGEVDNTASTACDSFESILPIKTVRNLCAAHSVSPPPTPHIFCDKPTRSTYKTTATSDEHKNFSARPVRISSTVISQVQLKEVVSPKSLMDECCLGVKKALNPYLLTTPTQIKSCTSSNLLTMIAPLSPKKVGRSFSLSSPSPEVNLQQTRTENGTFGSSPNKGTKKQAPKKSTKQRSGSDSSYARKNVCKSSKECEPFPSLLPSSSSHYRKCNEGSADVSPPTISKSLPATPLQKLQRPSQGLSPHLCPRMPANAPSFVIPQMPPTAIPTNALHPYLPSKESESSRKKQRTHSSSSHSLKMHKNNSVQTYSRSCSRSKSCMSSPTIGGLGNPQSRSRLSPMTFNPSIVSHDNRSRSVSTSSSVLSSPSPSFPVDVQRRLDSSLMEEKSASISSQPTSATHHRSHKQNRSTVHHNYSSSPFSIRNMMASQPCSKFKSARHLSDTYTQRQSVASGTSGTSPISFTFTDLSFSFSSSDSSSVEMSGPTVSNSKTSMKNNHLTSISAQGTGRTSLTTASSKKKFKSGRLMPSSCPSTPRPLRAASPKAYMKELTEIDLMPSSLPSCLSETPTFHQRSPSFSPPSSFLSFIPPQPFASSFPHLLSQDSSLPTSPHPPSLSFHPQSCQPSPLHSASQLPSLSTVHSQFNALPDTGAPAHPSFGNPSPIGSSRSMDLTQMSQWELNQLYYYNSAILENHKVLMKNIEDHVAVMNADKGGADSLHLSSFDVYKRFLDFTVEPGCDLPDDMCSEKFGFGDEGKELSDLILGGTPSQPIINSKYDIYANAGRMLQNS